MKVLLGSGVFLVSIMFALSCNKAYDSKMTANPQFIHDAVNKTTEIIVHDIFSPVVASRIYVYGTVALYETIRQGQNNYKSLAGQVKDLTPIPPAPLEKDLDLNLAGLHAYMTVVKAMIFSDQDMEDFRTNFYNNLREKGLKEEVLANSLAYGQKVADHILSWSKKDTYAQSRSFPKYRVSVEPGRWQPTPPAFIEAIEPSWNKIRTMVLDSANQFLPAPPTPYSTDTSSLFYKNALDVKNALSEDAEERKAIASFWDCNPYVMHQEGHLMFASKKITPGGHWMGITGQVCRQSKKDMLGTAEAYVLVAIGLFDGFISCWDAKFRSNLVRPETYINQYIDETWVPLLQTPPFPEHTSGHSVISTASAVILTDLFGDNYAFDDSTELNYNLPIRSFNSFHEAASEAAMSRLYGGIHYMPAIEEGVVQGRKVGELIVERIQTH